MHKIAYPLLLSFIVSLTGFGQDLSTSDSAKTLGEVIVTAFELNRRIISCGTSVKVLNLQNADRFNKTSLLNGMNTISGVRMEERSPGSYRINIRGSSLRSPFGVRNVKVYWNDIPITDPGGNTYFNQFAFNNFSTIEIYKGPAGSLYGAGTGGLILMQSLESNWKKGVNLEYVTGSFGLQNILGSVQFGDINSRTLISYAHNQSDGYRDHTETKKNNFSWVSNFRVSDKQQLKAAILYNDLYYQTPGGLTAAEYAANPKQARPAAGSQPSAETAKAAIYQKNFTAGLTHVYRFNDVFKNSTTLYGAFAQIKNPTFRNYERRNEPSFGGRSIFGYEKKFEKTTLNLVAGGELQAGYFNTQVSKNKNGNPDTLQTNDDIKYQTYSVFAQADINIQNDWIITAGISVNNSNVEFKRLNAYPVKTQKQEYKSEWAPRLTILKKLNSTSSIFGSVSKGYSPPTIAELLPSTGAINTNLEAEHGINYELGTRLIFLKGKLQVELAGFYFKLEDALVVRKDSSNADYFVNAGDTRQRGIELGIDYSVVSFRSNSIFENFVIRTAQSFNEFKYGEFKKGVDDFSDKYLPGVPNYTASAIADLVFKKGAYINLNFYHATSIFLNDANTAEAAPYTIVGARAGWRFKVGSKVQLNIYVGGDNLMDETYSLGNDINAAGGRYYNTAFGKNYYVGVAFKL